MYSYYLCSIVVSKKPFTSTNYLEHVRCAINKSSVCIETDSTGTPLEIKYIEFMQSGITETVIPKFY